MPAWVAIAEKEGGDAEELPAERDGSLLLASITNLYPSVTTLKYKDPTGIWRIVRCVQGVLTPPQDDGGWGSHIYFCIKKKEEPKEEDVKRKRKSDYIMGGGGGADDGQYDADDDVSNWSKSILCSYESDGISLTEDDFRDCFSKYGHMKSISVKPMRGSQAGTAFIAFNDSSIPMSLYGKHIEIDGIYIEVKEPETDDKERRKLVMIFRNEDLTKQELREHFEHYGKVTDIYIPKPFKFFGFVTFAKQSVCKSLYGDIHKYKGTELRLQEPRAAKEKREMKQYAGVGHWGGMGDMRGMGGMGRGMGIGGGMEMSGHGGIGMRGMGEQFGGGYDRPEKRQRGMDRGGFGSRGRLIRDEDDNHSMGRGSGGGFGGGRGPTANQSWKDMIESYGGSGSSVGGSATKSWNPDTYGYGGNKIGMMDGPSGSGGLGGPMVAGMPPPGVHGEQKPPCPFKLKNPDEKCPNFEVCREYYEHGTSYCKYMKRQMDASKGGMSMY